MATTTTTLVPPTYRRYSISDRSGQSPSECLPAYTRRNTLVQPPHGRRDPTEHSFALVEGRSSPWLTMGLRSSAKSSKSLPTFYEKENINGVLEIDADKADSIHSVTATVVGRIVTSSGSDDFQFLNIVVPIWAKSADQPRTPSPREGASGSKLRGRCSWPLSIPLPKKTSINGQSYRLPETFTDRYVSASVQYELVIKVGRGKLRSDSRLATLFGYVPSTRPEPPSPLRQLAYQENSVLPGPLVDPSGWKGLKSTSIRGTLFNSKQAEVKVSVSLAKPLSYTRGSVIPCSVTVESREPQLLDLLCAPEAIPLALRRSVQYYSKGAPTQTAFATTAGWNNQTTDIRSVVWWRSPTQQCTSYERHMEGEIRLPKDLKPCALVGHFSLSYNVVLRPLDLPGFSVASSGDLLSEPVEITTKYAPGPRPQAHSPPGYAHDTSPRSGAPGQATMYAGYFPGKF